MKRYHPLLVAAYIALLFSILVALSIVIFRPEPESITGLLKISGSLLLFGVGELINHPAQFRLEPNIKTGARSYRILHRERNPCTIGNLAIIVSLLLFFIGLGTFISF